MNEASFYTQAHNIINGREVWHYLICCPIGDIHILEYEAKTHELFRIFIGASNQEAEQKFERLCIRMLKGTL